MGIVTLVSGGLDSTVMALLAHQQQICQFPLFIDYNQRSKDREWSACRLVFERFGLPKPVSMDLHGFGTLVASGLTSLARRVNEDAFLPCRNLLFLLAGWAYAMEKGADSVAIGLLSEESRIFPDQTEDFLKNSQDLLTSISFRQLKIIAPLMKYSKAHVVAMARDLGVVGTYSCHSGTEAPCGVCVSCLETAGIT